MKEENYHWYSPILGRNADMLVFGSGGLPLFIFPTSMGSYTENRDFHLVETISQYIDNGYLKVYTPFSIDDESWYNNNIHPSDRARNHVLYDRFLLEEIVKPVLQQSGFPRAAFAGCSFGAYHALNFGFRHPGLTAYIIGMGGSFDIRGLLQGYYDDNVYFNNPPDFIPGLEDERLKTIGIILGTGTNDMCMSANVMMSEILNKKGISHFLDVREGAIHDWTAWREMFPHYIGMLNLVAETAEK